MIFLDSLFLSNVLQKIKYNIIIFGFPCKKDIMRKRIVVVILILFTSFMLKAQQSEVKYHDYNNLISNPDVFLDKKAFNPAYSGDTVKLKVDLKRMEQWIGSTDSRNLLGISVESYLNKMNSGLGITYLYEDDFFTRHVFKLDYNYRLKIREKLKIRLAASLGIDHYSLMTNIITYEPDPWMSSLDEWSNHPILAFGTLVNFKNHEFGLTVYDLFDFDFKDYAWNDPSVFKTFLISNYNYRLKVSEIVELTPEFIFVWNPDLNFWIVNTTASFKNRFYGGISVRSNDEISLMIAGRPWKSLKMGYTFSKYLSDISSDRLSYGFHGIYFSYLIF